jgi:hypothetical protein
MVNTHQKKIALLYTKDAVKLQETGRDSKIMFNYVRCLKMAVVCGKCGRELFL